jgi:hypothetical protein
MGQTTGNQRSFLGEKVTHLKYSPPLYPVEILHHGPRIVLQLDFGQQSSRCRTLEIIYFVNITMCRKEIVHDDEVNLRASRELDTM